MPIAISRDDERARLTAVASGELTLAELVAFIKTERAGPLVRYALLFDLRAATVNFTQQHVGALADVVGSIKVRFGVRAPVAIVASVGCGIRPDANVPNALRDRRSAEHRGLS
jgi:hypothetical protein